MNHEEQNPGDSGPATGLDASTAPGAARTLGTSGAGRPGTGSRAVDRPAEHDAVPAERLDPDLSVGPDTIDLSEPDLAPAEISRDVADAASLEAAAAEARAVAAEAEEASSLVGGPLPGNAPVKRTAHDATAPAGGVVVDTGKVVVPEPSERPVSSPTDPDGGADGASPVPGMGADDLTGSENQVGGAESTRIVGRAGGPVDHGASDRVSSAPPARDEPRPRSSALPLLLIIGAIIVLVGLLIWLVVSLISGLGLTDAAAQDQPNRTAAHLSGPAFT